MEQMQIHFNYLAIIATTALGFLIGGLWYGPLFGKAWQREVGLSDEAIKKANMIKIFGITIILNIIISMNLSAFLGPKPDVLFGLFAGLVVGMGWVSTSLGIIYLAENPLNCISSMPLTKQSFMRPWELFLAAGNNMHHGNFQKNY